MFASRSRLARRAFLQYRPSLESLEGRLLMAGLDVPQLSSRPGAAATIYLDFDGHFESSWGSFSNVTTAFSDCTTIFSRVSFAQGSRNILPEPSW